MRDRYIYRWGFVFRVREPKQVVRKFVDCPVRIYPGQIIDCYDAGDIVALKTNDMFLRRKS